MRQEAPAVSMLPKTFITLLLPQLPTPTINFTLFTVHTTTHSSLILEGFIFRHKMKLLFATLLLCSLLLSSSFLEPASAGSSFCDGKCSTRCQKAGVVDRCLKYCGICCEECKCVPSGTYGNKHECPCYRDKRSSKGKPKCP